MSLLETEKKAEEREKTIANEQAKITATYANGIAVALLAVGTLSPAISGHPTGLQEAIVQLAIGAVCLTGSVAIHYQARRILRELR